MADEAKRDGGESPGATMDDRKKDEQEPGNILAGVQPESAPDDEGEKERRED